MRGPKTSSSVCFYLGRPSSQGIYRVRYLFVREGGQQTFREGTKGMLFYPDFFPEGEKIPIYTQSPLFFLWRRERDEKGTIGEKGGVVKRIPSSVERGNTKVRRRLRTILSSLVAGKINFYKREGVKRRDNDGNRHPHQDSNLAHNPERGCLPEYALDWDTDRLRKRHPRGRIKKTQGNRLEKRRPRGT